MLNLCKGQMRGFGLPRVCPGVWEDRVLQSPSFRLPWSQGLDKSEVHIEFWSLKSPLCSGTELFSLLSVCFPTGPQASAIHRARSPAQPFPNSLPESQGKNCLKINSWVDFVPGYSKDKVEDYVSNMQLQPFLLVLSTNFKTSIITAAWSIP